MSDFQVYETSHTLKFWRRYHGVSYNFAGMGFDLHIWGWSEAQVRRRYDSKLASL